MPKIEDVEKLTGYKREDFSACLGCKICASVCTVNDLALNTNPQDLLLTLFLGNDVTREHNLVQYCTNCYRCTTACPWKIRIPDVVRALRETLHVASPFEKAFKGSVSIWGRVYEPYVMLMAAPFLLKEGYLKYMGRWTEYIGFHLPHKVKTKVHK